MDLILDMKTIEVIMFIVSNSVIGRFHSKLSISSFVPSDLILAIQMYPNPTNKSDNMRIKKNV